MNAVSPTSAIDRGLTGYADEGFSRFLRRAFLSSAGLDAEDLGRPIVGIAHTISDYVTCHRDMPQLVDAIERGILEAGGMPFSFPVLGLGEPLLTPTAMVYRNLAAIAVEELVRAQPMDSVVLVGGCDKTVPAQLMGAVSAGRPAIACVSGSMYAGRWQGERIGACTDCRRTWARHRAGEIEGDELGAIQAELCPTAGTCMVMGTASTMACVTEALGLMLPGGATPQAPSAARLGHGTATGRAAVALAGGAPAPGELLSAGSFRNAFIVLAAIGGSTNAVIHLTAVARRAGLPVDLDFVAAAFADVPLLVDLKPTGNHFMEHFHADGGVPMLMKELAPLLDGSARTVEGGTVADRIAAVARSPRPGGAIATLAEPLGGPGSLTVLRGSLAPAGALIKSAAASPELLRHAGRAVVFDSPEDAARRLDDPGLEVEPGDVLVLRNAGPVRGMPEAGSMPIPRRLAEAGVKDMVRVSDARMSGTSYGTVVLHCSPEAAVGGPLALVRDGDEIELDVAAGRIDLRVEDRELEARRAEWAPEPPAERGWRRLLGERVVGADLGADLDFLA
ncbi:MAG TPA: dihydroxy-acid dehydratase [Solirubrobacterales bacterium]|nr:dihydroxy-acid dehydratase [Solirubrobacterales bacterium]